jgi:hypothetical protein
MFHGGTAHLLNKIGLISWLRYLRARKLTLEVNPAILVPDVCLLLLAILSRPAAGR